MVYTKLYVHSLVDKLKSFYENARYYSKIYTICLLPKGTEDTLR